MALNFADLYEHAVDAFPERLAVACGDRALSYSELEERANRLAHYLAGIGVTAGDHVGLYSGNSIEALEALLACCKLRAAAININYRYGEKELRYMLADSDPVALIFQSRLSPQVAAALDAAPGLRDGGLLVIDDSDDNSKKRDSGRQSGRDRVSGRDGDSGRQSVRDGDGAPGEANGPAGRVDYEAALAAGSPGRDFAPRSADDVYIIYTGGTTGQPKGVMWRHEDIWRTLGGGIDFMTREPLPDEWEQSKRGKNGALVRLCAAPLIHGNAQVAALAGLFGGESVVLLPKFDAHEIWRAVERHKVNVLVIIGDAMARPLIDALRERDYDVSSLLAFSSSAALFSPAVKEASVAALPNAVITEAIGSTETGFAGIALVAKGAENRGGPTVTPGRDVLVIDDLDRPVGPGETGRLARGGNVPIGYYKDPAKTARMLVEVGGKRYAVPGDWARIEEDGSITLLGRGNTCVNTGGEKVFPEEVEGALKTHPHVFDALVIGVPDQRLGQSVAALVQPKPGAELDLDDLEVTLRGEIAGYKIPRSVWIVAEISRTVSGKADYAWAHEYTRGNPPAREPS
ncbi:MAG TPA: acyl-CoA synthetase [Trebonia sp.]|jgi:acyl-CoA synthetase (AMP-forming)/AMP-acid ligase II|nr:acyl-CoA synthetase [Trebonia sp.]